MTDSSETTDLDDAADATATASPADAAPFRRLNPLSIVIKALALISQNFIAILVLHFSMFDQNFAYTVPAAILLITAMTGIMALVWSRFTYQVTVREIRIKSGLLNRNNRSIPFDRIQDVSLEQKLLGRLLGLATVKLETGSGGGEDGQLDALSRADAEQLRDTIRDYKAGLQAELSSAKPTAAGAIAEEEAPPLFAMDNRRILTAGLFNFSFVLLALFGAVAQNLDFLLPDGFFDPRRWIEAMPDQNIIDGISSGVRIIGALAAVSSLITIGLVSGIVRTFIREYGFRLERVDTGQPGFRRRRGLFTLTDMVMPIHRVQAAIIQSGPVRERFGWYHLKFKSLASDASGETDHSAAPCATLAEIDPILDQCAIHRAPAGLALQPVDPALWWRSALVAGLILAGLALAGGMLLHKAIAATLLLVPVVTALRFLEWRCHQYGISGQQLYVRSGWWRRRMTILPLRKVQTVDITQAPADHPLDLASVTIGIAGGSAMAPLRIRAMDRTRAAALRQELLGRS